MSLMEIFADPSKIDSLSFGEKMVGSGVTMMMGMGITFTILILLWGCIAVMGLLMKKASRKPAAAVKEPATAKKQAAPPPVVSASSGDMPQNELIAVIAAAVSAAEGKALEDGLVIRKIQRMAGPSTPWHKAGQMECIDSRRV
jgi:sodium pump decarboxylase gamma subunit